MTPEAVQCLVDILQAQVNMEVEYRLLGVERTLKQAVVYFHHALRGEVTFLVGSTLSRDLDDENMRRIITYTIARHADFHLYIQNLVIAPC